MQRDVLRKRLIIEYSCTEVHRHSIRFSPAPTQPSPGFKLVVQCSASAQRGARTLRQSAASQQWPAPVECPVSELAWPATAGSAEAYAKALRGVMARRRPVEEEVIGVVGAIGVVRKIS